jgi:hypothetical protein
MDHDALREEDRKTSAIGAAVRQALGEIFKARRIVHRGKKPAPG